MNKQSFCQFFREFRRSGTRQRSTDSVDNEHSSTQGNDYASNPLPIRSILVPSVIVAAASYATLALMNIAIHSTQLLFLATPVDMGGWDLILRASAIYSQPSELLTACSRYSSFPPCMRLHVHRSCGTYSTVFGCDQLVFTDDRLDCAHFWPSVSGRDVLFFDPAPRFAWLIYYYLSFTAFLALGTSILQYYYLVKNERILTHVIQPSTTFPLILRS